MTVNSSKSVHLNNIYAWYWLNISDVLANITVTVFRVKMGTATFTETSYSFKEAIRSKLEYLMRRLIMANGTALLTCNVIIIILLNYG